MHIMFWVLSLGLPVVVIGGLFLISAPTFWLVWRWLIGTRTGRITLICAVVAFTLHIAHHAIWQQGYNARVTEDKAAIEAANVAVRKKEAEDTRTSETVAADTKKDAEAARGKSAETTAAAAARIRTIDRTIQPRCDPPTPAQVKASAAIDKEARAAVERARRAGK